MKLTVKMLLSTVIVFWNVENFFPPESPQMKGRRWTTGRYLSKCRGVAKIMIAMSDSSGHSPDVVGLAEVGDESVLRSLVWSDPLVKKHYRYFHCDSPDRRGIECAAMTLGRGWKSSVRHIRDSLGGVIPTRDLLLLEKDTLSIIICHLPSKVSKGGADRRLIALRRLSTLCDSLVAENRAVVAIGDFNEERSALSDSLMAPMTEVICDKGTLKYQGRWETIDRAFVSPGLPADIDVFDSPALSEPDTKYGGVKPRRTYIGPRWNRGLSDHYPIVLTVNNNAPCRP